MTDAVNSKGIKTGTGEELGLVKEAYMISRRSGAQQTTHTITTRNYLMKRSSLQVKSFCLRIIQVSSFYHLANLRTLKMIKGQKKLIIVGAGPQGQIAKDFFLKYSSHNLEGFASHKDHCTKSIVYGYPHYPLEELSNTHPPSDFKLFVAIGYRKLNKIRQSVYEELKRLGYEFANFIHPSASVSESAEIGENVSLFLKIILSNHMLK